MLPFPGDDHKFAFFGVEFEKIVIRPFSYSVNI